MVAAARPAVARPAPVRTRQSLPYLSISSFIGLSGTESRSRYAKQHSLPPTANRQPLAASRRPPAAGLLHSSLFDLLKTGPHVLGVEEVGDEEDSGEDGEHDHHQDGGLPDAGDQDAL